MVGSGRQEASGVVGWREQVEGVVTAGEQQLRLYATNVKSNIYIGIISHLPFVGQFRNFEQFLF